MKPSESQAWTPVHEAHGQRKRVMVREGQTRAVGHVIEITNESFVVETAERRNIAFTFEAAIVGVDA